MSRRPSDMAGLVPAIDTDIARITPMALDAELFDCAGDFESFARSAPWKVLVGNDGEAAILDGWREHLPWLQVRALWASSRRMPTIVAALREHATEHGFEQLVTSLVPTEVARDYERGGMHVLDRLVLYRYPLRVAPTVPKLIASGLELRVATLDDVDGILRLEAACFEPEWRVDRRWLIRHVERDRIAVLETAPDHESTRGILGYTLAILGHVEGSIGRLAVVPEARGRGLGAWLLTEAMAWAASRGMAGVTLCTQRGNAASRRLYERVGFRRVPGDMVLLLSDDVDANSVRQSAAEGVA